MFQDKTLLWVTRLWHRNSVTRPLQWRPSNSVNYGVARTPTWRYQIHPHYIIQHIMRDSSAGVLAFLKVAWFDLIGFHSLQWFWKQKCQKHLQLLKYRVLGWGFLLEKMENSSWGCKKMERGVGKKKKKKKKKAILKTSLWSVVNCGEPFPQLNSE